MLVLAQSVEWWIGLACLSIGWMLVQQGRNQKKQRESRFARAIGSGKPSATRKAADAQTLRKKDPNADSRLGQAMAQVSFTEKLQARFEAAGMTLTAAQYATRSVILMLLVSGLLLGLGKPLLLAILAGLLLGLGLPHMYVGRRVKKRKTDFLKLFPEAIELIVRGLRAGLPVAESFVTVSREIPAPVGDIFAGISQRTGLGVPMEKALSDAASKLAMTEFNFFVTTIILQRETGGNLGEILSNLAQVLRDRTMMKLKIGALSSEARASAYIVGALPFFVFGALSLVSPEYLRPLYDDYRGNMSLAVAGGMMLLGGFIMKRMTQLEI